MRRHTGILAITTGAAALAVVIGAAPAFASTTLTVKVTHGGTYTATASKTVLSDAGVSVKCTTKGKTPGSKGTGTVPTRSHKAGSPVDVGTVKTLAFSHCSGPLGAVKTRVKSLSYKLNIDSKTSKSGKTDGLISGVKVAVSMPGCSFNVTGSAPGYYTNSKHTLTMSSKLPNKALSKARLTVSGVSGCLGIVKNGQHPTYTSTYTISRKFVIKST